MPPPQEEEPPAPTQTEFPAAAIVQQPSASPSEMVVVSPSPTPTVKPLDRTGFGAKLEARLELVLNVAEAFLTLLIVVGCAFAIVLLVLSFWLPELRSPLMTLAKFLHDYWRAPIILLFPTLRASWKRIEARIQKVAGMELHPTNSTTGSPMQNPLPPSKDG